MKECNFRSSNMSIGIPDLRHCERLNSESNINIKGLDKLSLRLSDAWQIKYAINVEYQISFKIMMLNI